MRINKKLVKPLIEHEEYSGKEFVDVRSVALGTVLLVIALIISILLLIVAFDVGKWLLRKPGPPPKVITKVIKADAYSQAQADFVRACKADRKDVIGSESDNYGVPDVHTNEWTCTFPR